MDLCFYFAVQTQRITVLFLTSNVMVNKQSDFLAIASFNVIWGIVKLEL